MEDQKLIELIRSGKNAAALNKLYRNFPAVTQMVVTNGGNVNDAEDVFQDALIILINKLSQPGFVLTAQLSTYLFAVCRFVWQDEIKKRKKTMTTDITSGIAETLAQEIHTEIIAEEKAKLAERVLNELKDRCRELLLLFYHGQLKMQEIAKRMGYSSENSVKNQKYKCLEAAHERLKLLQQNTSTF